MSALGHLAGRLQPLVQIASRIDVKPFLTLLVLLLFAVCCFAQSAATDGSGLTVLKKKWHRELRDPALDRDLNDGTADRSAEDIRRRPMEQTNDSLHPRGLTIPGATDPDFSDVSNKPGGSADYVYEVTVRNDGSKDISSVTWEYVFLAPDSGQEVGRRRYTSKLPISRGKTRTLTVHSAIPPTGTIDVSETSAKTRQNYTEKIVIVSVEFADGSK